MKQGQCLIDAISCTFQGISVDELIDKVLGLSDLNWMEYSRGRYGYQRTTFFGSIRIFSNGRPDMGILIELQGQGCRELVQLTKNTSIFYKILSSDFPTKISLTRIDIAVDDFAKKLTMNVIRDKVDRGEIVTRLRRRTAYEGLFQTTGQTVYLGSRTGNYCIRFYDKSAEQHTNYPWIRAEIEIRHDGATEFRKQVLESIHEENADNDLRIVSIGKSILADIVRFVELTDKNISRCPTSVWWSDFLNAAEPIHLNTGKTTIPEINEAFVWMEKQCAGTFSLLVAYLGPSFIETLLVKGIMKIDRLRAQKWAQELEASGVKPEFLLDENTDETELFKKINKQIADHFSGLDRLMRL